MGDLRHEATITIDGIQAGDDLQQKINETADLRLLLDKAMWVKTNCLLILLLLNIAVSIAALIMAII